MEDTKKSANPFIPELIDILCPDNKKADSQSPINVGNTAVSQ
jgi:hypothetical protein|tara:strand:- start:502 stop:627 length:126 start_codon:yes stop_codon:yes gene_type:complete